MHTSWIQSVSEDGRGDKTCLATHHEFVAIRLHGQHVIVMVLIFFCYVSHGEEASAKDNEEGVGESRKTKKC